MKGVAQGAEIEIGETGIINTIPRTSTAGIGKGTGRDLVSIRILEVKNLRILIVIGEM